MHRLNYLNEEIKRAFANRFLKWSILLNEAVLGAHNYYEINHEGWQIRFVESRDEQGGFLEFYTMHKNYGDTHFRIYDSGSVVELEALRENYLKHDDIPGREPQLREIYLEENRKIFHDLKDIGLF